MAIPDDRLSTTPVIAPYLDPYDRYKGPLEDWEEGGIALYDGTQGMQIQIWHLSYNDDPEDPNYGDIWLEPEDIGSPTMVLNVPNIAHIAFAFNVNMDFIIAYTKFDGSSAFYWYDPVPEDYVTDTLPAGVRSIQCCLDDHRPLEVGNNDDIMAYIRGDGLYYRQQRDRYLTEYTLQATGVGGSNLNRVGMTTNLRLKFDISEGSGTTLCEIIADLCHFVNVTDIDVSVLCDIEVRGFVTAGQYTAADAIRSLMIPYFWDFPEIDGQLVAVMRGADTVANIPWDDIVVSTGVNIETAREQGVEFPIKMHHVFEAQENDYTPTKETSERRSPDEQALSEATVTTPVNFEATEAAQRCDMMHKVHYAERGGTITFGVDESYAALVPSDPVNVEVEPGLWKRVRLGASEFVDGYFKYESITDWQSAYQSTWEGAPRLPPGTPPPTIASLTTWAFLDLPTLITADDNLHYYVAGYGDLTTAWRGARLQREIAGEFENEADITTAETMGLLDEALPYAPAEYIDTTNSFLVTVANNAVLETCTDDQLLKGRNAAVIMSAAGNEIIQFRDVVDESGSWRLSHLLRGRLNTTPAAHIATDTFVFLGSPVLVPADVALLDTTLRLRAPSYGEVATSGVEGDYTFTGQSQREWAPTMLVATRHSPSTNDWSFSWMPRTRLGNSANPVVSSHFTGWRLKFTQGASGPFVHNFVDPTMTSPAFVYTAAMQTTDFGSVQSTLDVDIMGMNNLTGEGDYLSETV